MFADTRASYMVFDLLAVDGQDLRGRPDLVTVLTMLFLTAAFVMNFAVYVSTMAVTVFTGRSISTTASHSIVVPTRRNVAVSVPGAFSLRNRPVPVMVPHVPSPATKCVTFPSVCRQISGPVVR